MDSNDLETIRYHGLEHVIRLEKVALRRWFQLILCRTLIEKDKANQYLAHPSLLLPPSWSKASKMLDDARVDVEIVVANSNVSSPNTTIYTWFEFKVGFWENTSFCLISAHCFSSNCLEAAEP